MVLLFPVTKSCLHTSLDRGNCRFFSDQSTSVEWIQNLLPIEVATKKKLLRRRKKLMEWHEQNTKTNVWWEGIFRVILILLFYGNFTVLWVILLFYGNFPVLRVILLLVYVVILLFFGWFCSSLGKFTVCRVILDLLIIYQASPCILFIYLFKDITKLDLMAS